ncbi:50S ribosomal protein L24e [Candidatus Woesearchaeota archaeon]|nr:MAG: 50S ribosomal protein L24e [Candidatus Woesearchaeota archaeon]
MVKCSFSGKEIPPGTGIMYVKKDGKVLWFLNSKAQKNYLLGRKARDRLWTADGQAAKRARMAALQHEKAPAETASSKPAAPAKKQVTPRKKTVGEPAKTPAKKTAKKAPAKKASGKTRRTPQKETKER